MNYATDGKCHNANRGTFNHECGRPAEWIGTKLSGFRSGFCSHCRDHGDERHGFVKWEPAPRQAVIPGAAGDVAGMLARKAAAPLKPRVAQAPCDGGLFSDAPAQLDLVDLVKRREH